MTAMFQGKPIIGPQGEPGATFTPSVSAEGIISWSNDKDLPNPDPVNIKGPQSDVYSTEETVIGTWIDGKPLYRRVITGTTGSSDSHYTKIGYIYNVAVCTNIYGVINCGSDLTFPMASVETDEPDTEGTRCSSNVWYQYSSGIVSIRHRGEAYRDTPYIVVMEYTKTIDAVTTSQTNLLTSEVTMSDTLSVESVASCASDAVSL